MNIQFEKPNHTPNLEPDMELLLDFALLELNGITLALKEELDQLPLERIDQLVNAFKKVGSRPDELLFLNSLIALKMTKKNLETTRHFNRQVSPLTRAAME